MAVRRVRVVGGTTTRNYSVRRCTTLSSRLRPTFRPAKKTPPITSHTRYDTIYDTIVTYDKLRICNVSTTLKRVYCFSKRQINQSASIIITTSASFPKRVQDSVLLYYCSRRHPAPPLSNPMRTACGATWRVVSRSVGMPVLDEGAQLLILGGNAPTTQQVVSVR